MAPTPMVNTVLLSPCSCNFFTFLNLWHYYGGTGTGCTKNREKAAVNVAVRALAGMKTNGLGVVASSQV